MVWSLWQVLLGSSPIESSLGYPSTHSSPQAPRQSMAVVSPTKLKGINMSKKIFVFGSNEAGIHGAGAAKAAYEKHGARWGFSYGHMGNSFAIPTKDEIIESLPLERIQMYVGGFLAYATGHRKLVFQVTRIGCGLAGYADEHIAPMFWGAPKNCLFDEKWKDIFDDYNSEIAGSGFYPEYWGTV